MVDKRHETGNRGEQIAANYLQSQGYELLETNWRCDSGELDLIMRQQGMLVFVEVKSRHNPETVPLAAITPRKRARLIAAVYRYLDQHELGDIPWRIDAVAVVIPNPGTSQPIIEHVEDALDW